jgi:spore germination protein
MIKSFRPRWIPMLAVIAAISLIGPTREGISANLSLSAWITYWDSARGREEAQRLKDRFKDLSYFAAYFDDKGELVFPDALTKDKVKRKRAYLTIVNDVVPREGNARLKDTEFLTSMLATRSGRQRHAEKILNLVEKKGFTGVEVDYENIWKKGDARLQEAFLSFLTILEEEAKARHIKVRAILEPSVPFSDTFPQGIEYVVMAYNLYGTHSGPGPKANLAFIRKTCQKMDVLKGDTALAFSVGGAVWKDGKEGRFITEQEAMALSKNHGVTPNRDAASGALSFTYEEAGHTMTVWYADAETLNAWIREAMKAGYPHIFLWALGGNEDLSSLTRGRVEELKE